MEKLAVPLGFSTAFTILLPAPHNTESPHPPDGDGDDPPSQATLAGQPYTLKAGVTMSSLSTD